MADKYLKRDAALGQFAEVEGLDSSAGAGDAGKIPALGGDGRLDASLLPSGLGADTKIADAGEAIADRDFTYIDAAGEWKKASAASGGNAALGFSKASVTMGQPATGFLEGIVSGFTGLTPGARQYLSDVTPGGRTETPVTGTGKIHQYLGTAISDTEIDFEKSDPVILA